MHVYVCHGLRLCKISTLLLLSVLIDLLFTYVTVRNYIMLAYIISNISYFIFFSITLFRIVQT